MGNEKQHRESVIEGESSKMSEKPKELVAVDWDPFAYTEDVRKEPDSYVRISDIGRLAAMRIKIRHAPDMAALKELFSAAWKQFAAADDRDMLSRDKDLRKAELEK